MSFKQIPDPKQMLEYLNTRQGEYQRKYKTMENRFAKRKHEWESYKESISYQSNFDKYAHEEKIQQKAKVYMMENCRIANEKIKSTKECLTDMEKKASEQRISNEEAKKRFDLMRAINKGELKGDLSKS